MIDLQLPRPLMTPSQWPSGPALVSIESLRYGGPLALLAKTAEAYSVPDRFWIHEENASFAALMSMVPQKDLTLISRSKLSRDEEHAWRDAARVPVHFRVDHDLTIPTLLDWSLEVFQQSARDAGELHWTRLLRDYEKELGGKTPPGFDALRFLPAFLRSKKVAFALSVAREAAYADALFSPQDDARGAGVHVIQNPTLQIVTGDQRLTGFWRIENRLERHDLTWEEAAVLDELRETPKLPLEVLRNELRGKRFPLKTRSTFDLVIESLLLQGLLLLRP